MRLPLGRLHGDERAVAMVEFTLVFVPVLFLFLAILELSRLSIGALMVQRAAGIAVRACVVIKDQSPSCEGIDPGTANRLVARAATEGLRPLSDRHVTFHSLTCEPDAGSALPAQSKPYTARLTGRFECLVPMVSSVICQRTTPTNSDDVANTRSYRYLNARATHAHQGARYDCDFGTLNWVNGP